MMMADVRNDMKDSIYLKIRESDLYSNLKYKYSDLPYYILKEYLDAVKVTKDD